MPSRSIPLYPLIPLFGGILVGVGGGEGRSCRGDVGVIGRVDREQARTAASAAASAAAAIIGFIWRVDREQARTAAATTTATAARHGPFSAHAREEARGVAVDAVAARQRRRVACDVVLPVGFAH